MRQKGRGTAAARSVDERRRLVAARALRLFARLGFDKVSLQDIARSTGVPRTALYRYYRTKREIFDGAISGVLSEMKSGINATLAKAEPAPDRLIEVCDQVVDRLFAQRDFLLAIFNFALSMVRVGEDMSERVAGFTGGLVRAFNRLISEGMADGSFRRTVDPSVYAELLFELMESQAFNIVLELEKDASAARRRFRAAVSAISS